jgi:hypothetical protein
LLADPLEGVRSVGAVADPIGSHLNFQQFLNLFYSALQ